MKSNNLHFMSLFFLILLTWTITGLLGPMVTEIAASFPGINEAQVGLIASVFLILASSLSIIWALLEDRFSRKKLLLCAGTCWAVSMLLIYFSTSYFELFLLHLTAAVGYAAVFPIGYSMTMDFIGPERRARAFSFLGIAGIIGIGFSYLLGGVLVDFFDWRVPFLVLSILGFVDIGFLVTIKDPKKGGQEKELADILSSGVAYSFHIRKADLGKLVKNKLNIYLIAYNFLLYFARGGISFYIITMLKVDYLFSSTAATLLVIGTYGTMIAGNIFWGRRADKKFAERPDGKAIVILESLIIGPGFLVVAYSLIFSVSQIGLIILFAVLVAVGAFCTSPLIIIANSILGDINPPELRATVFSLNNIAQTIGRSLSIATAGLLFIFFGNSYHWGFVILMSLVFGGIALIYPLKKIIPKELSKLSDLLKGRAQQLESQSAITNN